jgi:hypothetical protein
MCVVVNAAGRTWTTPTTVNGFGLARTESDTIVSRSTDLRSTLLHAAEVAAGEFLHDALELQAH